MTEKKEKPQAFIFKTDGVFQGLLYSQGRLVARIDHVREDGSAGLRAFDDWKIYIQNCLRPGVRADITDPVGQLSVLLGEATRLSRSRYEAIVDKLINVKRFSKQDKRRLFHHGKEAR